MRWPWQKKPDREVVTLTISSILDLLSVGAKRVWVDATEPERCVILLMLANTLKGHPILMDSRSGAMHPLQRETLIVVLMFAHGIEADEANLMYHRLMASIDVEQEKAKAGA